MNWIWILVAVVAALLAGRLIAQAGLLVNSIAVTVPICAFAAFVFLATDGATRGGALVLLVPLIPIAMFAFTTTCSVIAFKIAGHRIDKNATSAFEFVKRFVSKILDHLFFERTLR